MNGFLYFLPIVFLITSCKDDTVKPLDNGYPKGFTIIDTVSINDCTLGECSDDRIIRLIAKDIVDVLGFDSINQRYAVGFPISFDSFVRLYICDLPVEFQEDGINVKYSGELRDACGYYYPNFPIEEAYILKLTSITRE